MGKITKAEPADIVIVLSGKDREINEAIVMGALGSHLNWALCNTGSRVHKKIVIDIFILPEKSIESGLDIKILIRDDLKDLLYEKIEKMRKGFLNDESWFSGSLVIAYRSKKSFGSMCFSI